MPRKITKLPTLLDQLFIFLAAFIICTLLGIAYGQI